jgi:DNA-binding transcriptional ArsR family regulator/DNA-directed RNA polymerase subunit M/transcription elongation factor TFIIS
MDASGDDDFVSGAAFEPLSDETRLQIMHTLAKQYREEPANPTMGFGELRKAVGRRDSGNFNYHLDKLRGRFIEDTDDGYRLSPAGHEVISAVVAGTYDDHEPLGPIELPESCPVCGSTMTARYESGLLRVSCDHDHQFRNTLPRRAVEDRSLEEIVRVMTIKTQQDLERIVEGICPRCYATVDWDVDVTELVGVPEVTTQCTRCGTVAEVPVSAAILNHPDVVAFYAGHDVDVRHRPLWAPVLWNAVTVDVAQEEPLELSVSVQLGGEELVATLDDSLDVQSVER